MVPPAALRAKRRRKKYARRAGSSPLAQIVVTISHLDAGQLNRFGGRPLEPTCAPPVQGSG